MIEKVSKIGKEGGEKVKAKKLIFLNKQKYTERNNNMVSTGYINLNNLDPLTKEINGKTYYNGFFDEFGKEVNIEYIASEVDSMKIIYSYDIDVLGYGSPKQVRAGFAKSLNTNPYVEPYTKTEFDFIDGINKYSETKEFYYKIDLKNSFLALFYGRYLNGYKVDLNLNIVIKLK